MTETIGLGYVIRGRRSRPTVVALFIVAASAIGASPSIAQTSVTSLDELRRELAAGDFVTVVPATGQPVGGRLVRFGDVDLTVRVAETRTPRQRGPRDVTIPLTAMQSLERPRDSARNGAALGAGIGAGAGGVMFVTALVVDRNEIDEWAASYAVAAAVCTGIGALLGWAIDTAHSKPHVRFDAASGSRMAVSVQPAYSQRGGVGLAMTFSR